MSQIELKVRDDAPVAVARVVVGWDQPLETFFLQVHPSDEDAELVLWLGTSIAELDLEGLLEAVEPYAVVPGDLRTRLEHDRLDRPPLPPTPFQKAVRDALGGRPA